MKLVNVEDLKVLVAVESKGEIRYGKLVTDLFDDISTVEAIPIEWIKDYIIPFQVHHDSLSEELQENDGAGWVVEVLETMLREWEKENDNLK